MEPRRHVVRVRRRVPGSDAVGSGTRDELYPQLSGSSQLSTHAAPRADSVNGETTARAARVSQAAVSKGDADRHLGQHNLTVLLEDRPAADAGVNYLVSALVVMSRKQLVEVLCSMGQVVSKGSPTRLELLGAVVCLLSEQNRILLSRSSSVAAL